MADPLDFKSIQDKISTSLVKATRASNAIGAEDISFQRSANPATGDELDELDDRLRAITGNLIETGAKDDSKVINGLLPLEDTDDIDNKWGSIVDVIDSVLERVDTTLDEYSGLIKRKDAPGVSEATPLSKKQKTPSMLDRSLRFANISKPQRRFQKPIDNFDRGPWKPILTSKPHAKYNLEKSLVQDDNGQYRHPYENEIIQHDYPPAVRTVAEPIPYQSVETTSAIWVDTFEGVLAMLEELKKADVIAVDLEHHDLRTFTGLLSLMQISTREKDWIVDTLCPWRHKLEILNEVFANPKIVKVLHGSQSDIIWLQRDLGLYIVGLFDTYFACEALCHPSKGLAGLLKRYVDFDADKKYQMADWRIRPIPAEMLYYARSDTHYLLYIFDKVRNELIENRGQGDFKNLSWVFAESKKWALQRHEGFPYDSENGHGARGWFNSVAKGNVAFDGEQFAIYRAVHEWRDNLARKEDESPVYLMGQKDLMQIAKIKPPDAKALISLLPANRITRAASSELFKVIKAAQARGSSEPSLANYLNSLYKNNPIQRTGGPGQGIRIRRPDGDDGLLEQTSQLWGKMKISSLHEEKQAKNDRPMPLPWTHQMDATASEFKPSEPIAARPKSRDSQQQHPKLIDVSDEEFIVKKGRSTKSSGVINPKEDTADGDEMEVDMISSDELEEQVTEAMKNGQKRVGRKQRAKKLAAMKKENEEQQQDEDEEAFDYSTAQSVLNAKRAGNGQSGSGKKFDPYTIGEGPKAARRMNHEKTGKTATFKK